LRSDVNVITATSDIRGRRIFSSLAIFFDQIAGTDRQSHPCAPRLAGNNSDTKCAFKSVLSHINLPARSSYKNVM